MPQDIVLFYYYSSRSLPENCFLNLSRKVVYRNIFLFRCADNKMHFEFPVFEDHSYSTICNRIGLRNLIKRPRDQEKYIIFKTKNYDTNEDIIVGYYRVGRQYYQETRLFNNNGFVCGIEADNAYLVPKGTIIYDGPNIPRSYRVSWRTEEWSIVLNNLIDRIETQENISDLYQQETNRLIEFFQDEENIDEWRRTCINCNLRNQCNLYRRYRLYNNSHQDFDMFSVLHRVYSTNIYSRNALIQIPRIYLR